LSKHKIQQSQNFNQPSPCVSKARQDFTKYFAGTIKANLSPSFRLLSEAIDRSTEAYTRARLAEAHQAELYDGPERPDNVVRREERRFVEELNSGIVHQVRVSNTKSILKSSAF
jgi:hypothetical protein